MKKDKFILLLMISTLITLMFYYRVQTIEVTEEIPKETVKHVVKVTLDPVKIPNLEGKTFKEVFAINTIDDIVYNRINNISYKENDSITRDDLRYLEVTYWGFDNKRHYGELIVNQLVAEEVLEIFKELYQNHYPVENMLLVDEYNGDDLKSMEANNTSAFNYRKVAGSNKLSNHSYGLAIDINPLQNPYVKNSHVSPEGGNEYIDRETIQIGMIQKNDICYQAFISRGWEWGGDWKSIKDYQHFEKKIEGFN
ncbi:MAG: M15 family metallopeptidase [Clostridiales bacterium]|nr:M15 family metallopeptidase [Clostridiales bacterium]